MIKLLHKLRYAEDDTDFEGDAWGELYLNGNLIYEDEYNNMSNTFIDGFLFALDETDTMYEYDLQKTNDDYDLL